MSGAWRLITGVGGDGRGGGAGLRASAGPTSTGAHEPPSGTAAATASPAAPPALPGAVNMAVDQAILEGVQAGGLPTLRLYAWDPPCLSLGRNQPAARQVGERARARGLEVVRRPTGGRAVLHDRELTYAVALPSRLLGSPRVSYAALNEALASGLRRLGVPAARAAANAWGRAGTEKSMPAPASAADLAGAGAALLGPCFQAAAPGEVVAAGRKLVGSAQRCEGRAILQHGSILLEGDQSPVAELLDGVPVSGAAIPATASVAELLGRLPAAAELVEALCEGFRTVLGISLAPSCLGPMEAERVGQLAQHFRSAAWTWRR